jgi:hypothetical protein
MIGTNQPRFVQAQRRVALISGIPRKPTLTTVRAICTGL